jgi:hypothetical protein
MTKGNDTTIGLTKLELFSAMAMQAMVTNGHMNMNYVIYSRDCVEIAKCLIKALNEEEEEKG